MKTITVLSGKGGVGKSSLSASLSVFLSKKNKVVAADCDVDAANLALLFGIKNLKNVEKISTNYKAFVNEKAKKCKNIVNNCAFSAISWNKKRGIPEISSFLCEGCGVCKLLCPQGISIKKIKNAIIGQAKTSYGFFVISGQLKMGESGSGNVVNVVKKRAKKIVDQIKADFLVIDSAPGIGCPVIASIKGCDYVIAITEPMPAAFSALKRVLQVVKHFKIPYGIVINKWDINKSFTRKIEKYAKENKILIIGRIPYDKDFIRAMIKMKPVIEINPGYKELFKSIINKINIELK